MATAETIEIVQKMYDCGIRGDLAGLFSVLSKDIVVREPAFLPYGGDYVGHDSFRKAFGSVTEHMDLAGLKVDRMIVQDDRAFAVVRIPGRKGGEALLAEESLVRNGKIVEIRLYFNNTALIPLNS